MRVAIQERAERRCVVFSSEAVQTVPHLLEQKHEGSLALRAQRIPDRVARVRHTDSVFSHRAETPEDTGLDRLVRIKRQGDLARSFEVE